MIDTLKKIREALEFYADKSNWVASMGLPPAREDQGDKASEALALLDRVIEGSVDPKPNPDANRFEVIDHRLDSNGEPFGRRLVYYGEFSLALQDDGRTLKVFIPGPRSRTEGKP
ncbi:hypothetical protein [Paludisphaera sp.]|uniref:hypothetical protein n=1 Tax=Paludisphaera sp. TaxID=2017432 RepID=UPI00301D8907